MSNLVNAVIKYREERARFKARQKSELEDHLKPWAADVGDEVNVLRAAGNSITDITGMIGTLNRTFVYDMIRAAKERKGDTVVTERIIPAIYPDTADTATIIEPYKIEYFSGVARVTFPPYGDDEESYDIAVIDGTPDLPEEWAEHTRERRVLYKQIAAEIRANLHALA